MALRTSTKIFLGFAVLTLGSYYGYQIVSDRIVMSEKFAPLTPGRVNVVGIDPGAGYQIIVANQMAQLVQTQGGFGAKESDNGGADSGAIKKRVPVKEMLEVLQGSGKALGPFVMTLNDMSENDDWPSVRVVWTKEQIQKALNGDKALQAKLEHDLNMHLDGTPLSQLSLSSLANGIIIDTPVSVIVNIDGKQTPVVGRVQEPYRPRMIRAVEESYKDKQVTPDMIKGYYAAEAMKALKDKDREIISDSLKDRISDRLAKEREETPERVLKSATIVINDSLITDARYKGYDTTNGKMFDLTIDLTDEGRRRLWQFSKGRVGTQLLLVTDGIPIEAPQIQHELAQGELTVTQMPDEVLVRETVDMINEKKGKVATR